MAIAWPLLLTGIGLARYARHIAPAFGPDAFWFRNHWMLQLGGSILVLGGAVAGVAAAPPALQFATPHSFVGAGIAVCVLLQVSILYSDH